MAEPVLLVLDEDVENLRDVERELNDRYARNHSVVCSTSPSEARSQLEGFAESGVEVALVLAGQGLAGTTRSQVRDKVRHLQLSCEASSAHRLR